jgi:hypothetical protein
MLYQRSFLEKTTFENAVMHGGGVSNDECVAGFPAFEHLSVPLGLVLKPISNRSFINGNAIMAVMNVEKYDVLYERVLETKNNKTKRKLLKLIGNNKTKRTR